MLLIHQKVDAINFRMRKREKEKEREDGTTNVEHLVCACQMKIHSAGFASTHYLFMFIVAVVEMRSRLE